MAAPKQRLASNNSQFAGTMAAPKQRLVKVSVPRPAPRIVHAIDEHVVWQNLNSALQTLLGFLILVVVDGDGPWFGRALAAPVEAEGHHSTRARRAAAAGLGGCPQNASRQTGRKPLQPAEA